jgi:3'-phosphoadenosine 5'-phosphosulfate sulfotransferase (PAPS reductase)/FAD synthetase
LINQYCFFLEERFHYIGTVSAKAFFPAKIPFPLLHVDTGHNFPETIEFRDRLVKELGLELIVRNVQDAIDEGKVVEETGKYSSRTVCKLQHFLDAEEFKLMLVLVVLVEMKKKRELKNVFCS